MPQHKTLQTVSQLDFLKTNQKLMKGHLQPEMFGLRRNAVDKSNIKLTTNILQIISTNFPRKLINVSFYFKVTKILPKLGIWNKSNIEFSFLIA